MLHKLEKIQELLSVRGELFLRVKVRASRPIKLLRDIREVSVDGHDEIMLYIDVTAKAEHGRANKALEKFIGELFGLDSNNVHVILGKRDPLKVVKVQLTTTS